MTKKVKKKATEKSRDSKSLLWKDVLYEDRFLETYTGPRILQDEVTAIVELIANAWDAGATEVSISWPDDVGVKEFSIRDNGIGMTSNEFLERWRRLSYDRRKHLGDYAMFPDDVDTSKMQRRVAYGRNGKGRFSAFCFGFEYFVETCKGGQLNRYRVSRSTDTPFQIGLETSRKSKKHGTRIYCPKAKKMMFNKDEISSHIGMRFLTDPDFQVSVNGMQIDFSKIEGEHIQKDSLKIKGIRKPVELLVIDTLTTDRTTRQHGVAWHVTGRLVGDCSWKGMGRDKLIDGRRTAAKRYQFIVKADCLAESKAIKDDWTGFDRDNEQFESVAEIVYEKINEYMLNASEDDRNETYTKALKQNKDKLRTVGPASRENWRTFVRKTQEVCPSIREYEIMKLSELLATMEQAKSKYSLLHQLSTLTSEQLDQIDEIIDKWSVQMIKDVLDEVEIRLKLIVELQNRVSNAETKEVQDLQPLFKEGLWIFGPQYESIEYTSNEGMTKVVQKLFKKTIKASLNRPDFAILPDGSTGLYSFPTYNEDGNVVGVQSLVVIELKKPGLKIADKEKNQPWKYVKELYAKSLLDDGTDVKCFVVGSHIDPEENYPDTKRNGKVKITPLTFDSVLSTAKNRMLKLYDKIKDAPVVQSNKEQFDEFMAPVDDEPLFAESA